MFIHDLFDMSEVERVVLHNDNEITQNKLECKDLLNQAISEMIDSVVNAAASLAFEHDQKPAKILTRNDTEKNYKSTHNISEPIKVGNKCI